MSSFYVFDKLADGTHRKMTGGPDNNDIWSILHDLVNEGRPVSSCRVVKARSGRNGPAEGQSFDGCRFEDCHFKNTHFDRCSFRSAVFINCVFSDCVFSECDLTLAHFAQCRLSLNYLKNSTLRSTLFDKCRLEQTFHETRSIADIKFRSTRLLSPWPHQRIIIGGDDKRGYQFLGFRNRNRLEIFAGCRHFARFDEAVGHWRSYLDHPRYREDPALVHEHLLRLAFIRAQAISRGWHSPSDLPDPLAGLQLADARNIIRKKARQKGRKR